MRARLGTLGVVVFLLTVIVSAQTGQIAGVVRDANGAVLPGVTVELSSPALIEKVRATVTDANGRYQFAPVPVGSYVITFQLRGFATVRQQNIVITTDFTATVNAQMRVGALTETVEVKAEAPVVNVTTGGVAQVLQGSEIADLPSQRDVPGVLNLVPGFQSSAARSSCDSGVGVFCNPSVPVFNAHTAQGEADPGHVIVNGMAVTGANAAAPGVAYTLSGALGESQIGNVVVYDTPRYTYAPRMPGGESYEHSRTTAFIAWRTSRSRRSRSTSIRRRMRTCVVS
jgi:hypothetical protein